MTHLDIDSIVRRCAELVREHYVFAEAGEQCAVALERQLAEGRYGGADSASALGALVTTDLQGVTHDLHLRLKHHLDPLPPLQDDKAEAELYAAKARDSMHGIRRIERLSGNIGLVEIAPNLFPPAAAGQYLAAAMQIVANTRGLILDLRANTGGHPGTVALVCTYLLGDEPVHLNSFVPRDESEATQSWTLPWVPGPRYGQERPLWVLVGPRTFSGGEELAYDLQQLGRATLVGEVTGGGANARRGFDLHPHLELTVPVVAARNPVSGTNWEGTGVRPDVTVPEADALDTAHGLALEALADDETIRPACSES